MIYALCVLGGMVVGVGLGWVKWGWHQRPAPLPFSPEILKPVGTDRYRIVLSTGNATRARKIYERAEVAAKESVAFWDDGEQRGVRIGPSSPTT